MTLLNSPAEKAILKARLLHDFGLFARWFFKVMSSNKFVMGEHHAQIVEALTRVANGETRRLIINIPPRYGKTELAVKLWVAWVLANNPSAKFIHLSYSDELALDNSSAIRDLVKCAEYQELFPTKIKADSDSKKKWYTSDAGGVYATAAGGAVTGFGAGSTSGRTREGTGSPADGFGGAIIIDDPLKPDDAFSDTERNRVNRRYNNTIASRCNSFETPVVVIMQRLHMDDLTGFLLSGGSGEVWEHLCLSAVKEDDSALWPFKHTREALAQMEKADAYTFAGQYRQMPVPAGGNIIKLDWIRKAPSMPDSFDRVVQSWDLAVKDKGDYVAGAVVGKKGPDYYVLDMYREKVDFVGTLSAIRRMCAKWPQAKEVLIEDKANGPAVMSVLKSELSGIIAIEPNGSREARVHAESYLFESGNVIFPINAPWVAACIDELTMFPSAPHDDTVDAITQALHRLSKKTLSQETIDATNSYFRSNIRQFPNR